MRRKNKDDSKETREWLIENVDYHKFKSYFLEGALQKEEQIAYEMYSNEIGAEEKYTGKCMIISARWCERMSFYMKTKF